MQTASVKTLEIGHIFDGQQRKCFPGGSTAKTLPVMQKTQVRPLGQKIPCRRAWQPTPVFLLGESPGQRGLGGYSSRGCKESDTTY